MSGEPDDSEYIDIGSLIVGPGMTMASVMASGPSDDDIINQHWKAMRFWIFDYVDILAKGHHLSRLRKREYARITHESGYAVLILTNSVIDLLGHLLLKNSKARTRTRFLQGIKFMYPALRQDGMSEGADLAYEYLRNGLAHSGLPRNVLINDSYADPLRWGLIDGTTARVLLISPKRLALDIVDKYEQYLGRITHPVSVVDRVLRRRAVERLKVLK